MKREDVSSVERTDIEYRYIDIVQIYIVYASKYKEYKMTFHVYVQNPRLSIFT